LQPQGKLVLRIGERIALAQLGAFVAFAQVLQVFQVVGCVKFGHTAEYRNL
jgi:hypothetical protein